jgi:hypothetical protein
MGIIVRLFSLLIVISLSTGCASILSGNSQTITLSTNPPGARCEVVREGRIIGTVENTPGAITIDKTKHDMDITCKKDGFTDAKGFAESGTEGATFGNILLGGGIGWAIDSAAGADNKYPDVVTVNLVPVVPQGYTAAPTTYKNPSKSAGSGDLSKKLSSLKKMKDEGLLTEEEYQKKRADIIDKL